MEEGKVKGSGKGRTERPKVGRTTIKQGRAEEKEKKALQGRRK